MISKVQFEVRGLEITFTNPNASSLPTEKSDEIVLKKAAEIMIEQVLDILIESRKSKNANDNPCNIKLLYDEIVVLDCKDFSERSRNLVKNKV